MEHDRELAKKFLARISPQDPDDNLDDIAAE
jgi:hypothetical protein